MRSVRRPTKPSAPFRGGRRKKKKGGNNQNANKDNAKKDNPNKDQVGDNEAAKDVADDPAADDADKSNVSNEERSGKSGGNAAKTKSVAVAEDAERGEETDVGKKQDKEGEWDDISNISE